MTRRSLQELQKSSHLSGANAAWIEEWYEDWLNDPDSVPAQWAEAFEKLGGNSETDSGRLGIEETFRQLGRLAAVPPEPSSVGWQSGRMHRS